MATGERRGGRRLALGCGVPIAVLACAALGVWVAGSADAPPPDDADVRLDLPAVAPALNAITWLEAATSAWVAPEGFASLQAMDLAVQSWGGVAAGESGTREHPWDDARVAAVLDANSAVLAHLERAATCDVAQPLESVSIAAPIRPGLMETRRALHLLMIQSESHRPAGRHADALASLASALRLAGRLQRGPVHLIQHMIGTALRAQALAALRRLAADPALTPDQCEAAADLAGALPDEAQGLQDALRLEYAGIATYIDDQMAGRAPAVPDLSLRAGFWFHPNRTRALLADDFRAFVADAARRPSERTAVEPRAPAGAGWIPFVLAGNGGGKELRLMVVPGIERCLKARAGATADRLLTRCWLLALAHRRRTGALPPSLQALVGQRLPEVPLDPFDGKLLRYDPRRGWLWSAGEDGVDGGGTDPAQARRGKLFTTWPDPTLVVPE